MVVIENLCINNIDEKSNAILHNRPDSPDITQEKLVQKTRERMELVQKTVLREVDNRLDIMIEEMLAEKNCYNLEDGQLKLLFDGASLVQHKFNISSDRPRRKPLDPNILPEKEFIARNSLLTDLLEVKHIKTIYHIFLAMFLIIFLNTLIYDFVANGTINLGLHPLKIGFANFHLGVVVWIEMQLSTLALYALFKAWVTFGSTSKCSIVWIKIWLLGFIAYQMIFTAIAVLLVFYFDICGATAIAILMEMVRFLMKTHAYVRTNVPRAIHICQANKVERIDAFVPSFSRYCYFLFAPTLVYRDNYPRTKQIRWWRVIRSCLEFFGCLLFISFLFERFLMAFYQDFGATNIKAESLVLSIFGCMLIGTIVYICGFYGLLHAWMNASAEVLCFADRLFYKDWWNATSFDAYHRTWNCLVYDWLYQYMYKDMYEIVFRQSKAASVFVVFIISSTFHEFILAVGFRFFYPVMLILFQGIGFPLMFIRNRKGASVGNLLVWLGMIIANGLFVSLYTLEYFARQNCQFDKSLLSQYFVPMSWQCNSVVFTGNWTMPWTVQN